MEDDDGTFPPRVYRFVVDVAVCRLRYLGIEFS